MVRKLYKCPVEGCNYVADSIHKVHGHIVGSNDPAHKELRKQPGGLWDKIIVIEEGGENMGGNQPVPSIKVPEEEEENRIEKTDATGTTTITTSTTPDNELLELSSGINVSIMDKISELEEKISQLESMLQDVIKRLDVHKEALTRILRAFGVHK